MNEPKDRIIAAMDLNDRDAILGMIETLREHVGCFKFGLESLNALGLPAILEIVRGEAIEAFIDQKLHDIPATMGAAAKATACPRVRYFNVHASAGIAGMKAAVEHKGASKVLAVTVLTSMDDEACLVIYGEPPVEAVLRLGLFAKVAGVDGLVCSPRELKTLRDSRMLADLDLVTPGVRPAWAEANDQKRVMTPGEAIAAGATALVIGRPILKPPRSIGSPIEAAKRIGDEIEAALAR